MKIMHVGQMIGGLDVYIRNSIVNNKDDSIEFVIVCGQEDKHQPVIRKGKIIKEHPVSLYRSLNPIYDLTGLVQVVFWIMREKPDIIHCHSAKGGMIGRLAGWLTGTKTLYTPHAFSYLSTPSKLKRKIFLYMERLTKINTFLLACSESERQMGIQDVKYKQSHALVWHNAVPDALKIVRTGIENVSSCGKYVCYIGRPCYQKNTLFLAEVMKKVKEQGCPLKFMLLGVGYYSSDLERLKAKIREYRLEEVITLEPWLSHTDCLKYVQQSAFYVTTSLYEGLPLSVIEAMSLGKAIVASDVAGNKDCVQDGINGYLVPLDVDMFARKVCLLWNDNQIRRKFEKASRRIFVSDFFIDKQIDKLCRLYTQLYMCDI